MFFKSAIIYQITESMQHSLSNINALLSDHAFTPCKSQEHSRYGWTLPQDGLEDLCFQANDVYLIQALKEEKVIPSKAVNKELKARIKGIEYKEGRKIYSKEKLSIKDEIILDMLPRAFSTESTTQAMIMPKSGLIIVDVTTHAKAEELLSLLRNSFGSLPIKLPDVTHSPSSIMSQWLNQEELVPEFKCLEKCQLNDQSGEGSIIRVTGQELQCDEITMHLDAGKSVVALELEWDETMSFSIKEDLTLKQIKPSDSFATELNEEDSEDKIDRLRSDLHLVSGNFSRLVPQLFNAFGGLVATQKEPGAGTSSIIDSQDALYSEAVPFVVEAGKVSISAIQRKFLIGYNRAARLVETMEAAGIISGSGRNGHREVIKAA